MSDEKCKTIDQKNCNDTGGCKYIPGTDGECTSKSIVEISSPIKSMFTKCKKV